MNYIRNKCCAAYKSVLSDFMKLHIQTLISRQAPVTVLKVTFLKVLSLKNTLHFTYEQQCYHEF